MNYSAQLTGLSIGARLRDDRNCVVIPDVNIADDIADHNESPLAHPDIRSLIASIGIFSKVFIDSGSNQTLQSNIFYLANGLSLLNLILPSSPVSGDRIALYSYASGLWRLNCAGHLVEVGDKRTSVNGYIDSKNLGDFLEIEFQGDRWICTELNGYIDVI